MGDVENHDGFDIGREAAIDKFLPASLIGPGEERTGIVVHDAEVIDRSKGVLLDCIQRGFAGYLAVVRSLTDKQQLILVIMIEVVGAGNGGERRIDGNLEFITGEYLERVGGAATIKAGKFALSGVGEGARRTIEQSGAVRRHRCGTQGTRAGPGVRRPKVIEDFPVERREASVGALVLRDEVLAGDESAAQSEDQDARVHADIVEAKSVTTEGLEREQELPDSG